MSEFTLEIPTKVYFRNYITTRALKAEERWVHGTVMLITTGRTLTNIGYVEKMVRLLETIPKVKEVIVFDHISANPKLEEVKEAVFIGKTKGVNCIVGFGGGSALDAAKAAAAGIGSEHHIKAGIRGEYIYPKAAIVDPVYTWSVPKKITMETGFDVLAHAIESFLSVKATPFSEIDWGH